MNPLIRRMAFVTLLIVTICASLSSLLIWKEKQRADLASQKSTARMNQVFETNEILAAVFDDLNVDEVNQGTEPFRPSGTVHCLYGEELDLHQLGSLTITRGSHVEPTQGGQWTADLAPVKAPYWGRL